MSNSKEPVCEVPQGCSVDDSAKLADSPVGAPTEDLDELLVSFTSQRGRTLREMSAERPVIVALVRHTGCTFCREMLDDLRRARAEIEQAGVQLAIVHLSDESRMLPLLARYGLDDVDRFYDPRCRLYRAFGLRRGNWWQLFGGSVMWRGFLAAIVRRHGFGWMSGDVRQLAGVVLLQNGKVIAQARHTFSADRPDYLRLARHAQGVR